MEDNHSASTQQYVTFSLGDELFGVEVTRTREILSLTSVTKVPQTPDYLLGVINLRGQVVPVVDMRLKLGLQAGDETEDTCIIVVDVQVDGEAITVGLWRTLFVKFWKFAQTRSSQLHASALV